MRSTCRYGEGFNLLDFQSQCLVKIFPGLLAIADIRKYALAGVIGDLGHPVVEIPAGMFEMLAQGGGIFLQLAAEFANKFIISTGKSRIARIKSLAIQRRDVEFLLQNPKMCGLRFIRREAGRRRRLSRPKRGQAKD